MAGDLHNTDNNSIHGVVKPDKMFNKVQKSKNIIENGVPGPIREDCTVQAPENTKNIKRVSRFWRVFCRQLGIFSEVVFDVFLERFFIAS